MIGAAYQRWLLPHLVRLACGSPAVHRARDRLVPQARGRVLELGAGAGPNFARYSSEVREVVAIEPVAALRRMAAQAPRSAPVELHDARAEALPFAAASFDSVVCTFTFCSLDHPEAALREVRRVLRTGGRLYYCEHGLSPDASVARWQRRLEPTWRQLAGGCRLTRDIEAALTAAGFVVEPGGAAALPATPRWLGWTRWGSAKR